jgi:hypothetical protein
LAHWLACYIGFGARIGYEMIRYYCVKDGVLNSAPSPPAGMVRVADAPHTLLPPQVSILHEHFAAWRTAGYAPGPVIPARLWTAADGSLAFAHAVMPQPLSRVGLAPDLAAWLVLLDKWMETFVVIARARAVWSPDELAGALSFTTTAYLPTELVQLSPENSQRVATALASAIADGPLQGSPQNRHWQEKPRV